MHDDEFHSGAKPMESMQGGMFDPHTQAPMHSEAQTNPRSAGTDNVNQTWNTTTFAPKPGLSSSNDKNKAH